MKRLIWALFPTMGSLVWAGLLPLAIAPRADALPLTTGPTFTTCAAERSQMTELQTRRLVEQFRDAIATRPFHESTRVLELVLTALGQVQEPTLRSSVLDELFNNPEYQNSLMQRWTAQAIAETMSDLVPGVMAEATRLTETLGSGYSALRVRTLTAIASAYVAIEQPQQALTTLDRAQHASRTIQGAEVQTHALTSIAEEYLAAGATDQAIAVLHRSRSFASAVQHPDPNRRGRMLAQLAIAYAKSGQLSTAMQIADAIPTTPYYQGTAWAEITRQYAQRGDIEQAQILARRIDQAEQRAIALAEVAVGLANQGTPAQATRLFTEAVELARTTGDYALIEVMTRFADTLPEGALVALATFDNVENRALLQARIALAYHQAGATQQANAALEQVVQTIWQSPSSGLSVPMGTVEDIINRAIAAGATSHAVRLAQLHPGAVPDSVPLDMLFYDWAEMQNRVARRLVDQAEPDAAYAVVQGINPQFGDMPYRVFPQIAVAYLQQGQLESAQRLVTQVNPAYPVSRVRVLAAMARQMQLAGDRQPAAAAFAEASQVTATIPEVEVRLEALGAIALEYGRLNDTPRASAVLRELLAQQAQAAQTNPASGYALSTVAATLINAAQYDAAMQVIAAIADESQRNMQVQDLVNLAIARGEYDIAATAALLFTYPDAQVQQLLAIATRHLYSQQPSQALALLAQAVPIARTIPDPERRVITLVRDYDSQGNPIDILEIEDDTDRASAVEAIALLYAQLDQEALARETALLIQSRPLRQPVLQRLRCYQTVR